MSEQRAMTTPSEGLRPCPFCGHKAELVYEGLDWWAECSSCGAEAAWSDEADRTVDGWNRRTQLGSSAPTREPDGPSVDLAGLLDRVIRIERQIRGLERVDPLSAAEYHRGAAEAFERVHLALRNPSALGTTGTATNKAPVSAPRDARPDDDAATDDPCVNCDGTGYDPIDEDKLCRICGGTGDTE